MVQTKLLLAFLPATEGALDSDTKEMLIWCILGQIN